ncbi:Rrf2 family transcriptional regulator [Veillonella criceti]|uniref:HTH-type transcriptional regulator iscR n=1 Tax=Veillonella criceti TaxID=103891 RepID=A0A380NPN3_9FIRM|nr:Rrf2 family transcriptional regulator [Veillonella criceti]SUP44649.1 HTH-type transcriptional regulator iscR [Veillonella criceti]
MKISKSLEQATFVLLMLALQKEHRPIKSIVFSQRLGVSDSYLKKVLRKLVVAGLISSNASKDGGFQLSRNIETITLYDVYKAVETDDISTYHSEIARHLFSDEAYVVQSETKIRNTFLQAENILQERKLSDLIRKDKYTEGAVEWSTV